MGFCRFVQFVCRKFWSFWLKLQKFFWVILVFFSLGRNLVVVLGGFVIVCFVLEMVVLRLRVVFFGFVYWFQGMGFWVFRWGAQRQLFRFMFFQFFIVVIDYRVQIGKFFLFQYRIWILMRREESGGRYLLGVFFICLGRRFGG